MTDTSITLSSSGTTGSVTITASAALFAAGDVGRSIALKMETAARAANNAYSAGMLFYADDRGVRRLYRVIGAGTSAVASMAGTTPNYDLNMPTGEGFDVVDGSAVLYYLGRGKSVWGWGTITGYTDSTHITAQIFAPLGASSTATAHWRLGAWGGSRGYPSCVGFYQSRSIWAGSIAQPQTIWSSETGDYLTFSPSEPDGVVLDTNGVTMTLDDDQVNTVRWLSASQRGIVLGTQSGEWLYGPASATTGTLTPSNQMAKRQGDRGSGAKIPGFRIDGTILYVQRGDQKLREFTYDFAQDAYQNGDLTILSEHITGAGVVDMARTASPDGVLWLVRSDGLLASVTYDRDQEVRGWARHALGGGGGTNAVVESVAAVPSPDGTTDDLYVMVRRGTVRTLEVIRAPFRADRDGETAAFYVDCGLSYNGTPINRVTGLSHLEGQTVWIMADGASRTPQVVNGGAVSIGMPSASVVHVGLPFRSRLTTLPIAGDGPNGPLSGARKRIHEIELLLHETGGVAVGPRGGTQLTVPFRTQFDAMTEAVPLFTGVLRDMPNTAWDRLGQLSLWSVGPQPMTIQGLVVAYHVGD